MTAATMKNYFAGLAVNSRTVSDDIPAAIRAELNAETDREVLERMRYLAQKKRMRQPDITDEQMADYLALAENYTNFAQWRSARHQPKPAARKNLAWAFATLAILGILTATLIVTIAILV